MTSYKITPYVGSTAQTPTTINGSPPANAATITGLTTGTTYTFTVQAINPTGSGPVSAQSNAVTPLTAVAPAAPTGVAAQAASSQAKVSWTAPAADGDSPITGYTVTPYVGATAQTPVSAGASATSDDGHRPDQRHGLHVQGHRHQRRGHESRVGAPRTP